MLQQRCLNPKNQYFWIAEGLEGLRVLQPSCGGYTARTSAAIAEGLEGLRVLQLVEVDRDTGEVKILQKVLRG